MARPIKIGLQYFPLDTDFFQDKKIKILKGRHGSDGIAVYIYLLCEIYRNGYYIEYDEDLVLCVSNDLNLTVDSTRQIISFLLSRSLLRKVDGSTLAKSDTVLTATSIQRRFQEAMKGLKRSVAVKAEYWLLKAEDTLSFIKVHPYDDKSEKNTGKSEKNTGKSEKNPTNKKKEDKKKINENRQTEQDYSAVILSAEERKELEDLSDRLSVESYISKLSAWQQKNRKLAASPYLTIRSWIEADRDKLAAKKQAKSDSSYDIDEWEQFAKNFDLNKR